VSCGGVSLVEGESPSISYFMSIRASAGVALELSYSLNVRRTVEFRAIAVKSTCVQGASVTMTLNVNGSYPGTVSTMTESSDDANPRPCRRQMMKMKMRSLASDNGQIDAKPRIR
jgi:hypothetical protein